MQRSRLLFLRRSSLVSLPRAVNIPLHHRNAIRTHSLRQNLSSSISSFSTQTPTSETIVTTGTTSTTTKFTPKWYQRLWTNKYKIFTFLVLIGTGIYIISENNQRMEYDDSTDYLLLAEKAESEKQYPLAEQYYQKCYQHRQQIFGHHHHNTINALLFLIECYLYQEKYESARKECQQLLSMIKSSSVSFPAIVYYYLAFIQQQQQQQAQQHQQADAAESTLADEYYRLFLEAIKNLPSMNQQKRAFQSIFRFIMKYSQQQQEQTPQNAKREDTVNTTDNHQGTAIRLTEALYQLLTSENYAKNTSQEIILDCMILLAALYQQSEQYEKAESLLKTSLVQFQQYYGKENEKSIDVLYHLGEIALKRNDYVNAKSYYRQCFDYYDKKADEAEATLFLLYLGLTSQEILRTIPSEEKSSWLHWFGFTNSSALEKETEQYFQQYYQRQLHRFGQLHQETLRAKFYVGKFHLEKTSSINENTLLAKNQLSDCYFYQYVTLGKDHSDTKETAALLIKIDPKIDLEELINQHDQSRRIHN